MLMSLGLDFRQARLEVRERFHLDDESVRRLSQSLAAGGVRETVVARTCNRIEVYCWWEPDSRVFGSPPGVEIARAWVGAAGPEADLLRANARLRADCDAARHLFRVAAGLESQILGDIHILGQLRRAYRDAVSSGSVSAHLHRLFESALRVGKRVKRDTRLMTTRSSVGSEAARRAAARAGDVSGRSCLVVGCGKSGTHAARMLSRLGATDLTVVNRTVERAEKLARELGSARAAGLDALPSLLQRAELIVVATGAPEPVLRAAAVRAAFSGHASRPLVVVDVSVPRNVETGVGAIPGVDLIDLDTLSPESAEIEKCRLQAVPDAEALVEEGVLEFAEWLELRAVRRALHPLQAVLAEICRREVTHLAGASALAERTAGRIVASVMAHPMSALRAASQRGERLREAAGALGSLFRESGTQVRERAGQNASEGFPQTSALSSRS